MKKRLTFQCGNMACKRKFSFQQEITEEQELIFTCPFCTTELIVKLEPFRKRKKIVIRGEGSDGDTPEWEYIFPEVVLAKPRNE